MSSFTGEFKHFSRFLVVSLSVIACLDNLHIFLSSLETSGLMVPVF